MSRAHSASERAALLTDAVLQNHAGQTVFERGRVYAASGTVKLDETAVPDDDEQAALAATVRGTQTYGVRVGIDHSGELHGDCDCPHAADGNFCKHQVALCLAWRALLGGAAPVLEESAVQRLAATAERARAKADRRDALRQFLGAQPAELLAERLWAWAETDRGHMAELKSWAAASRAAEDPKALRTALTEILRDRRAYLGWRESAMYAERANAALMMVRPWVERDASVARELCEHALQCLYSVGAKADDSSGALGDVQIAMMELLHDAIRAAPPPASWVDRWFALMDADPWGLWQEHVVLAIAGPAVQGRYTERVLKDWLAWQRAHPREGKAKGSRRAGRGGDDADVEFDISRSTLRARYLRVVAAQDDPRALLAAMADSADAPHELDEIVALCESHGWFREALQWAQKAVQRFPRDGRGEEALLRCYERDGWDDEALVIRRKQLGEHASPENYLAVLRAAERAGRDLTAFRAELFAWAESSEQAELTRRRRYALSWQPQERWLPDVTVRVRWLLAEKDRDGALALALTPGTECSESVLEGLARQLPAGQAPTALILLQRVFGAAMLMASSPYTRPLQVVRLVLDRMPPTQQAEWLDALRSTYKAKRNFIKALPPAG